jgi:rare lipoprotein A (peptidoglycan hydrolase)
MQQSMAMTGTMTILWRALIALACSASLGAVLAAPVAAQQEPSIEDRLATARQERGRARTDLEAVERRLADLAAEYRRIKAELDVARRDVVVADQAERSLSARLSEAQAALDTRVRVAYQMGPGATIGILLAADTLSDLASLQIYAARAIDVGAEQVDEVMALRDSLNRVRLDLRRRQARLAGAVDRLDALNLVAAADLAAARASVASTDATVKELEQRQRELEERERELAEARAAAQASIDRLVDPGYGTDQSDLLALLGPNQGRGCDIPPSLVQTNLVIEGISSWYGWELAGQATASGAIFDPRLFTAANKELPLGTFLRVHFQGKCAIVLVNDRGPYQPGWIIDLSKAAADYLGLGLGHVTADVLVPA